jgi:AmmeMemoRadiSam system protein A
MGLPLVITVGVPEAESSPPWAMLALYLSIKTRFWEGKYLVSIRFYHLLTFDVLESMMEGMKNPLTSEERAILLKLARQSMENAVRGKRLEPLELDNLPERLRINGATFVTLTREGELRGCIGALEAQTPLAEDVREHAIAAALQDFRFPPVQATELPEINIEISRLTEPQDLDYGAPRDLLTRIRPQIDGVIISDGWHRATFLPQVWDKLPEPETFLSHLCLKMGVSPDLWRSKKLRVQVYQVEEFHE